MSSRSLHPVSTCCLILITSFVMICGFSLSHSSVTVTHAQDNASASPSATPDLEKERLQRAADLAKLKQDKAEADQKTAEARKAQLEAMFPKPSTSPLEGKTTVEGAVIESQMISYVSLARAANRIVKAIRNDLPENSTLAIYNEQDVDSMLSYQVAASQVNELITSGYCSLLTNRATQVCPVPSPTPCPKASPSPSPSPSASPEIETFPAPPPPQSIAPATIAASFLGAFVDMTALLRTDVDIKGQTFTIDEAPLAAEIFRCAIGDDAHTQDPNRQRPSTVCPAIDKLTLYYPYVFPPNVNSAQQSPILGLLETAHNLNGNALQLIDAIEKDSKGIDDDAADLKALKIAIKGDSKAFLDAMTDTGIAIRANCPKLTNDVQSIMEHPENQSTAMMELVDHAIKVCPHLRPDKVALLLGLQKTVGQTAAALDKATKDFSDTTTDKANLESDLTDQLKKLKLKIICCSTPDELKDAGTAAIAQLKAMNAQFDNLVTALTQTQTSGLNPLTNYIRTERLNAALGTSNPAKSFWLVVKVINAGGNNRIKTNLIVDIFRGGNRISHSGGVIAQYHLFRSDGTTVRSGTVSDYTNYINAEKVNKITGSDR